MSPFLSPAYKSTRKLGAIDAHVGMYLVGGKLQAVPGYTLFAALGAVVRGCLTTNDRTFFVAGATLYELDDAGTSTSLGTLRTSEGAVSMAYGISQLVIVDGDNGYVLTLATDVFAEITSDAFYGSDTVTFLDNYFHFVRPDTGQFYISDINDATTLDALDFATAESQPDNLIAIMAVQRRLLLFGAKSIEVWFDSGAADFPFEREGTTIEVGCIAPHSLKKVDNTAFWLGQDENGGGVVYRLNGYQAARISEDGVDEALQTSTDLSQATAYAYQENGLTFYAINAPGLTSTWVYEVKSGAWHERVDLDALGQPEADRGVCHTYAFGLHLIGGSDGNVYQLDSSVFDKEGDPLVREVISTHMDPPSQNFMFYDAFHLDSTTGDAPQGVDPHIELSWSDDSGARWSNAITRSTGKVGERFQRITWRRLGRSIDRVWRLRFTDDARLDIVNVTIDSHQGNA